MYYLQTGSKTSALFIYLVLTHFGQKAAFKDPPTSNQNLQLIHEM